MKTLHIAMLITALTLNFSTYTVGAPDGTPSWMKQDYTHNYTRTLTPEEQKKQKLEEERIVTLMKAQQEAAQQRLKKAQQEAAELAANIKAVEKNITDEKKKHAAEVKKLNGQLAVLKQQAGQNNIFSCCTIS